MAVQLHKDSLLPKGSLIYYEGVFGVNDTTVRAKKIKKIVGKYAPQYSALVSNLKNTFYITLPHVPRHYGMYIGKTRKFRKVQQSPKKVILHMRGESNEKLEATLHTSTLEAFRGPPHRKLWAEYDHILTDEGLKKRRPLEQRDIEPSKSQEVVMRCVDKMGKTPEYNLLTNNCEHVVRSCVGQSSNQASFFWQHIQPQLLAQMSELFMNGW